NLSQLFVARQSQGSSARQVFQRGRIILRFKFRKPTQSPCHAHRRAQFHYTTKSNEGFPVVARVVIERSQVPPTFIPVRLEAQTLLIHGDRLVRVVALAGLLSLSGTGCERTG